MKTKTITLCNQKVNMLYCAAAENGYEQMTGEPIYNFNVKSQRCWTYLALAAIVAAYAQDGKEAPIDSGKIIYEAKPAEIQEMIEAVIELRSEWYKVPEVIEAKRKKTKTDPKN